LKECQIQCYESETLCITGLIPRTLYLVHRAIDLCQHGCGDSVRKSGAVPLTLLAAAGLAAIGCHDQPRHCVDAQGRLLPDASCQNSTPGFGVHYVYGGSSGGHVGDIVVGASSEPGIFRGGFGGHGGGDGGGGE
jgi:hypothetical protein